MTTQEFLISNTQLLKRHGLDTARLDCITLLTDVLNINSAQLLSCPEAVLSGDHLRLLTSYITRRTTHEPLAYIRSHCEFYGYKFYVNPHVLVPRPESETIIDILKNLHISSDATIVDVGTGSGILAITAKLELPDSHVIATDIDTNCLSVASQNAESFGASIGFFQGNLIEPILNPNLPSGRLVFMCNLPYVPNAFAINTAAKHEPQVALFGGNDGLDHYRNLFIQLDHAHKNEEPIRVLTECLPSQHKLLTSIAASNGFTLERIEDFIQLFVRN